MFVSKKDFENGPNLVHIKCDDLDPYVLFTKVVFGERHLKLKVVFGE